MDNSFISADNMGQQRSRDKFPHIEVLDREGMIILSHLYINWKEVDQKESPVELLIVLVINMEDLI